LRRYFDHRICVNNLWPNKHDSRQHEAGNMTAGDTTSSGREDGGDNGDDDNGSDDGEDDGEGGGSN
jgi:hypothetical protein